MAQFRDAPLFNFDDFAVNPRAHSIHKHGVRLKLHGQPFEILLLLLERPGEVVTREELRTKLWPANTFVDFEHSVNTAVKKLRRTLGDSADEQRFIETVPRVGYRFIAPVNVAETPANPTISTPQITPENSGGTNIPVSRRTWRHRAFRFWPIFAAASIVLIVSAGAYLLRSRSPSAPQPPTGRVMLAVLPFENLTGDASQDYFSDGLTEEMIAQLGQLNPQRLGVIGRASVMHYRHNQDVQQIARDLGIQYVLEGSVRRDSQNVRITAQLIRISDQRTVWSREYDRELTSILVLQEEIAQEIADEIQLTLGDTPRRITPARLPGSPTSYEAYDLYLKGRYFLNKRSAQGFQQAIDYFQQAIAKDPRYALAYAGLADSYALTSSYNLDPGGDLPPKARAAALRALQIDENLAEAHTALALIAENYDWDWQTAGREFRRAIELNPNYPTAHHWYAEYLAWQGRFDEALAESDRARQLDPLSLIISTDHAAILYYSGQYDRAIEQLRTVLDMEPDFPRANGLLIQAYVEKGQFARALAAIEKLRRVDDSPGIWVMESYVYGRAGQLAQARRALAKFEQSNRRGQVDSPVLLASAYAGMGDKEKLFNCLQKAFVERSNSLTALKVDPIYGPFRADPRFQTLLRRVGLTQ